MKLSEDVNVSHTKVIQELKRIENVLVAGKLALNHLSQVYCQKRHDCCDSRQFQVPSLEEIVNDDKK